MRAWQLAWSLSRFSNLVIPCSHYAAAYADHAADAAAVAADHDADHAMGTLVTTDAYAADAEYAKYTFYAQAAEAAARAADTADTAAAVMQKKTIIEYLRFLDQKRDVATFLDRPFDDDDGDSRRSFLDQLRNWEEDGFDFWADWYEARWRDEPLDEQLTKDSCKLPEEILSQSPEEINAYLKSLQSKSADIPLNRVRAIFIGFGAAGKTSLIRVLHGEPVVEGKEKMTAGIDIRDWPVPDTSGKGSDKTVDSAQNMTAHLWDFGGQVMAHATHQFFLRSRCLYVLVLDGRTEINANEQAEYWLEHIRAFGGDSPVLLVGNKADQAQVNMDMRYLREKYPNIVDFYPVSCIRCQGLYKAEFERFHRDFIDQLRIVGMHNILFSKPHFSVLQTLRKISPRQTFLPKNKYEELCREKGIQEKGELDRDWLLDLLDKLGVIIHFPDLPWLGSYLLNPRWLTYGVYFLFYSEQAKHQQGYLTDRDAIDILSVETVKDNLGNTLKYAPEHCRVIVDALKQFEIAFRLENEKRGFLIPALLPPNTPEHGFDKMSALAFDFDFGGFLPRHVTPGFVVRRHREIADGMVWQNGVKLRSRNLDAEALAQADYHERRLSLWVRGSQAGRYFSALHDDVMQMMARMPDLKYREWVRLPGGNKDHRRAGFRHLLALEAEGERRDICEYGKFDLSEVLKIMPPDRRKSQVYNIDRVDRFIGGDQMGDNIHIHDIEKSAINVRSRLDNAGQIVKTLSQASSEQRDLLEKLLGELHEELKNAPEDKAEDAEIVAEMTETLVEEAKKQKPEKKLQITAKGLTEAAGALANVAPNLLTLVKKIAETVLGPPL